MTRIVGACLSQFHDDPNNHEFLIAYADGREIGHAVSTDHAMTITRDMASQLGLDDIHASAFMISALQHLRDVFRMDHVVVKGNVDLKAGVLEVIENALSRTVPSVSD